MASRTHQANKTNFQFPVAFSGVCSSLALLLLLSPPYMQIT